MFTRVSRSGGRAYLQLVQAYRNPAGQPRQRVVANLGRLDQLSDADLQPLIGGLERALGRTPSATPRVVFDSSKAFGDLFTLHALWTELGLSSALSRALRSSRRQFDAAALIRAMVFNRLCAPDSKLGVLHWLDTVAMPDVPETVTHDQLLRSMDALMDRVEAVEKAVAGQLRPLLDDTLKSLQQSQQLQFQQQQAQQQQQQAQIQQEKQTYITSAQSNAVISGLIKGYINFYVDPLPSYA